MLITDQNVFLVTKSRDQVDKIIAQFHSSKSIPNASFSFNSCSEICKECVEHAQKFQILSKEVPKYLHWSFDQSFKIL